MQGAWRWRRGHRRRRVQRPAAAGGLPGGAVVGFSDGDQNQCRGRHTQRPRFASFSARPQLVAVRWLQLAWHMQKLLMGCRRQSWLTVATTLPRQLVGSAVTVLHV